MVLNRVVRFDTLSHIAKRPVYVSLEILTGLVAGRELVAPCFSPLSVRVSILTRNKRARRLRRLVGWGANLYHGLGESLHVSRVMNRQYMRILHRLVRSTTSTRGSS